MALNDIIVPKENAQGDFAETVLTPAQIGAVSTSDSRLSDSRTPTAHTHELASLSSTGAGADDILASDGDGTASWRTLSTFIGENIGPADIGAAQASHAATHAASGSDPVFDQDLNTTSNVEFNGITTTDFTFQGANFPAENIQLSGTLSFTGASAATNAATTRTNIGAAASGSITSSGLTQSTARILGRTTASAGAIEEIQIGSGLSLSAGELSATGSGVTAVGASTADVLSVSGSDLVADDPNADRIVFWDDSESKLRYLEAGSGLSISGTTMTVTATGGATNLWIPASAWIPKTTAGCGVDSRETTTNDQNFDELLFDTGSDELADALVIMPSNYNNGTITARFYWTAASGSGGVAWGIQGRAFANDDALDTAAGTAQLVTDTLIAANDMHVTSATSAVTIGGTPAANTPIQFTIYRDVSDAADTLGVDARLLGVEILFN
jgi:hypothetical protein